MTKEIRPSTLDGIKRLAKSIKSQEHISYSKALAAASKIAGYANYRHAMKGLSGIKQYNLYITCYWKDKKLGDEGRETLTLKLGTMWSDLITTAHFRYNRALSGFRREGPDHVARRSLVSSQSRAREVVCAAARTLQFIVATQLRPAASYRVYPASRASNGIPGEDHSSVWYEPKTKRYLLTDEPYLDAVETKQPLRDAWAKKYNFEVVPSAWPGMYYPDGRAVLFLVSDREKGVPVDRVESALKKLPPPHVSSKWEGESGAIIPPFVSPGAIEHHQTMLKKAKKRVTKPSTSRANTIGYVRTFGGKERRPNARMPIHIHKKIGSLLKSVINDTYYRKGAYNRVDTVRHDLDEWVMREYSRSELSDDEFFNLYYREEASGFQRYLAPNVKERHLKSLEEAKKLLQAHYPECQPLNGLLRNLDYAIKSIESWKPA